MPSHLEPIPKRKFGIMAAGVVVVPGLFLGGYLLLKQSSKSEVSGSIQLGPTAAAFVPNRCESGLLSESAPRTQPEFHGVDIFDAARPGRRVRVLEDPEKGTLIAIRNEGAAPIGVKREACTQFEVKLEKTDAMILERWGLRGTLRLKCPEIAADVRFASCYDGS